MKSFAAVFLSTIASVREVADRITRGNRYGRRRQVSRRRSTTPTKVLKPPKVEN